MSFSNLRHWFMLRNLQLVQPSNVMKYNTLLLSQAKQL